jgi:hypothetical protein
MVAQTMAVSAFLLETCQARRQPQKPGHASLSLQCKAGRVAWIRKRQRVCSASTKKRLLCFARNLLSATPAAKARPRVAQLTVQGGTRGVDS